jgi:hypothetical protein
MVIAIAVLLLQIPAIPQSSTVAKASVEIIREAVPNASAEANANAATASSDRTEAGDPPITLESRISREPSQVSEMPSDVAAAVPPSLSAPKYLSKSKDISKLQDLSEKLARREWLILSVAQHSAATFDAWSTRRAISSGEAHELNPTLRPFAGNPSIYAAIQVGPVLFDYLGRRMMTSRYGWARR